jgi:hypothetical protein
MIASMVAVNFVALLSVEPMRRRMNARFLDRRNQVEKEHAGFRELYCVHEAVRKVEYELVVLGGALFGDIFAILCFYGYVIGDSSVGNMLFWMVFVGILLAILIFPCLVALGEMEKTQTIIVVSNEWLEIWNADDDDIQCIRRLAWSELDPVFLLPILRGSGNLVVDAILDALSCLMRKPRDYRIVLNTDSLRIDVDAR